MPPRYTLLMIPVSVPVPPPTRKRRSPGRILLNSIGCGSNPERVRISTLDRSVSPAFSSSQRSLPTSARSPKSNTFET